MTKTIPHGHLGTVNGIRACQAAYSAITGMEKFTPVEQVAGALVLHLALCRYYNVHPGNSMDVAQNIIMDLDWKNPNLKAFKEYFKNELDK